MEQKSQDIWTTRARSRDSLRRNEVADMEATRELRLEAAFPLRLSRGIVHYYLVSAFLGRRVSHARSHPGRSYDNVYHLNDKDRSHLYEALRRR